MECGILYFGQYVQLGCFYFILCLLASLETKERGRKKKLESMELSAINRTFVTKDSIDKLILKYNKY